MPHHRWFHKEILVLYMVIAVGAVMCLMSGGVLRQNAGLSREIKQREKERRDAKKRWARERQAPTTAPKRKRTTPPTKTPAPHQQHKARLIIASSLKPCEMPEEICIKQWNALKSWTLTGADVHLFGTTTDEITEGAENVKIHTKFKASKSGVPLLSGIVKKLHREVQRKDYDAVMWVNGDIILPPEQLSNSLQILNSTFYDYFAVGHRTTIPLTTKLPFDNLNEKIEALLSLGIQQDRTDAEDYFIWSKNFFDHSEDFPDFVIGRPAYDNWLVSKAVQSGKPVVDLTETLLCLHQKHDYAHLKEQDDKKHHTYWNTAEQKQNYDLGKKNGGWRFGLIEFAPFRTGPSGCAIDNIKETRKKQCKVTLNEDWKPPKGTHLTSAGYGKYKKKKQHP